MKKTATLIVLCMSLFFIMVLTACDSGSKEPEHIHTFNNQIATNDYLKSEATCTTKAVYWLSCECGEKGSETFESGNLAQHDFSTEWNKGNGKHWHACKTKGCLITSNEEEHSFVNGTCICGELEPVVDINKVSQNEWEVAFELENVTINQYLVTQGQNILIETCLLDGSNAAIISEGFTIPIEDTDFIRVNFDFTNCYNSADYSDGKYFVASFDVYGDGSYVYEDAYLTFENGVLKSITAIVKEEFPEHDDDYNEIGTTVETSIVFIEFVDYGSTEIFIENNLPISQQEWESAFSTENVDNMTAVATFSGDLPIVETIYFANGYEKIIVSGRNNVELYCINSTWYTYTVSENTFVETDVFGDEYPYTTFSGAFKELFMSFKNMFTMFKYDSTEDVYYYISDSGSFYITINEGKVANLTTIYDIEGQTLVDSFAISNYGTTLFDIPFEPVN